MSASTPRLGVAHPTVVPTNFRRERDDEAPTDEAGTDDETPR